MSPTSVPCLCADDFGLHSGINAAVLDLARAGRLHATGCMVDGAAWAAGAPLLRDLPALQAGLHLDLSEALCAQAARKVPLRELVARAYARRLDAHWLRADIARQLDAFEDAMQAPPAFVDGHQHVHQLPIVREALLHELHARYGQRAHKPWLRCTKPVARAACGLKNAAKARLIYALGGSALVRLARQAGFATNHALAGVYGFDASANAYSDLLRGWLRACCAQDILMCHPAQHSPAADPIGAARQVEYEVLRNTPPAPAPACTGF